MEWVETTGRTLEDATEAALDQLGIDESDAEILVIQEPRLGLFNRLRGEARVRARVRPATPPPKRGRRRRPDTTGQAGGGRSRTAVDGPEARPARGGTEGSTPGSDGRSGRGRTGRQAVTERANGRAAEVGAPPEGDSVAESAAQGPTPGGVEGAPATTVAVEGAPVPARRRKRRGGRGRGGKPRPASTDAPEGPGEGGATVAEGQEQTARPERARQRGGASRARPEDLERQEEESVAEGMSLEEQGQEAARFVEGLLDAMGIRATVSTREVDEDTVEVAVDGDNLGLLIGPAGATLAALQEVTRTAVQRRSSGHTDRIVLDVAGYRARRAEALGRFTRRIAEEVVATGTEQALDPMPASDRKIVHDTANEIVGVVTRSEGEDPRRYVVLAPTAAGEVAGDEASSDEDIDSEDEQPRESEPA